MRLQRTCQYTSGASQFSVGIFISIELPGYPWRLIFGMSWMEARGFDMRFDNDPWKVSSLVSAFSELLVSILLFVGTAIAFITSQLVRVLGRDLPCSYIVCCHHADQQYVRGRTKMASCLVTNAVDKSYFDEQTFRACKDSQFKAGTSSLAAGDAFQTVRASSNQKDLKDAGHPLGGHVNKCSISTICSNYLRKKANWCNMAKKNYLVTSVSQRFQEDDCPVLSQQSMSRRNSDSDGHADIPLLSTNSSNESGLENMDSPQKASADFLPRRGRKATNIGIACDSHFYWDSRGSNNLIVDTHDFPSPSFQRDQRGSFQSFSHADSKHESRKASALVPQKLNSDAEPSQLEDICYSNQHVRLEEDIKSDVLNDIIKGSHDKREEELMYNAESPSSSLKDMPSKEYFETVAMVTQDDEMAFDNFHREQVELKEYLQTEEASKWGFNDELEIASRDHEISSHQNPEERTMLEESWKRNGAQEEESKSGVNKRDFFQGEDHKKGDGTYLDKDEEDDIDAIKEALQAERNVSAALEAELEKERNAAAIAANEAMAMISRLQEEKAAMQVEVAQLQRMSEEKADYDQQAMSLLEEILFKREKEKFVLEKEVELYRERLLAEKVENMRANKLIKKSMAPLGEPTLLLTGVEEGAVGDEVQKSGGKRDTLDLVLGDGGSSKEHFSLAGENIEQTTSKRARGISMNTREERTMNFDLRDIRPSDSSWLGLPGKHENEEMDSFSQECIEPGKCASSMDDEETHSILDRLWAIEEELHELRGQDSPVTAKHTSRSHAAHHQHQRSSAGNQGDLVEAPDWAPLLKERTTCMDPCGVHPMKKYDDQRETASAGVVAALLPIHDVYEVQPSSNQHTDHFWVTAENEHFGNNLEFSPRWKVPRNRMLFSSHETHQEKGWIVEHTQNADDVWDQHELNLQSFEEVQQLTMRMKALEADRELLRQALDSIKQKDSEITLLEEIVQHLRRLRFSGRKENLSEDLSLGAVHSAKKGAPAIKKRRYSGGGASTHVF